MNVQNPKNR